MAYNDRATLRSRARVRADQDLSTFPSDSQYNDFLDDAGRETWFDLVAAGWPANFTSQTVTPGGSPAQIAAGAPVLGVRSVFYNFGGQFWPLRRINPGKEALLRSLNNQTNFASFYEVRQDITLGTVVEFFPTQAQGNYRVDYVPDFAGFANDAALWQGPPRSDEMLVTKAAAKGCRKEQNEGMARALDAEYATLYKKVTAAATWLDMRNPAQIRDETSLSSRTSFDFPVAGPSSDFYGTW
jgi:hypothetical protein